MCKRISAARLFLRFADTLEDGLQHGLAPGKKDMREPAGWESRKITIKIRLTREPIW